MRGCKELRNAASAYWHNKGLSAADLERLGTLGSVLPALKVLSLSGNAADPDGVRLLAEGLGAGDLPSMTHLILSDTRMGDPGAAALAAALTKGALPRIEVLAARDNGIGDAGLVALAQAHPHPHPHPHPHLKLYPYLSRTFATPPLATPLPLPYSQP